MHYIAGSIGFILISLTSYAFSMGIDPLESFISNLPSTMKNNPVFIYDSKSAQGASFQYPRTILASEQSNEVYSFNGHPDQAGYDRVEAMRFDPVEARFSFFEVTFDQAGNPKESAMNPPQCMTCHRGGQGERPDPRPNWESYDRWLGNYGSQDDRLTEQDTNFFLDFLRAAPTMERYQALQLDSLQRILGQTSHYGRLPKEPNITMTHILSTMNFKRVARLISESENYDQYKYMIAGFLSRPSDVGILPQMFDYYSSEDLADAVADERSVGAKYAISRILKFRSLFESRGVDTTTWFMAYAAGVSNTFLNGTPWEPQLLKALLERDPQLRSFFADDLRTFLDWNLLIESSRLALEKVTPRKLTLATDPESAIKIWNNNCVNCHQGIFAKGPVMSWYEARSNPYFSDLVSSGEMPKEMKLTKSQINALLIEGKNL